MHIQLDYHPRPYQQTIHDDPSRFKVIVLHRRAGKTVYALYQLIKDVIECKHKKPQGAYIAPLYSQAKRIAWQYIMEFTRGIPNVIYNQAELTVIFPWGARIMLLGADNPDNMRGMYFDSVVMDEVAQMSPRVFSEVVRPALADRKGKCTFIGTPMGHNAFYEKFEQAVSMKDWSRYLLKWDDTNILDPEEVEAARREMTEAEFDQEFSCSWSAAIRGAYYAKEMDMAKIMSVPYDANMGVITTWDLGISDATVVWCLQVAGAEVRAINCLSFQGIGLPAIVKKLNELPYAYTHHIFPHDVAVRELGTGISRIETLASLGVRGTIAPKLSVADGVAATKALIPRMVFDADNCKQGIDALRQYRTEYDDKKQVFKNNPLHDWTSDFADSLRYYAVSKITTGVSEYDSWDIPING